MSKLSAASTLDSLIYARCITSGVGLSVQCNKSDCAASNVVPQYAWTVPPNSGTNGNPMRLTFAWPLSSLDQTQICGFSTNIASGALCPLEVRLILTCMKVGRSRRTTSDASVLINRSLSDADRPQPTTDTRAFLKACFDAFFVSVSRIGKLYAKGMRPMMPPVFLSW